MHGTVYYATGEIANIPGPFPMLRVKEIVHGVPGVFQLTEKVCIVFNVDGFDQDLPVNRNAMDLWFACHKQLTGIRGDVLVCMKEDLE